MMKKVLVAAIVLNLTGVVLAESLVAVSTPTPSGHAKPAAGKTKRPGMHKKRGPKAAAPVRATPAQNNAPAASH